RILEDHVTAARLKAVEAAPDGFDRAAWHALAEARLLGVALPEDDGGSGLGVLELCLLLEQVGRAVAPVPVFPTLVLGALAIAEFGTAEQRRRWLPGVATGEVVLTAAIVEPGADDPGMPAAAAARDAASWRVDGVKTCVPAAQLAARVLVPARLADGSVGIFLVDPRGGRLHRRRGDPPDHLAGGVAARGRSPGDGRGGGREVLGVGSRAPRRVCRAAPARRHRRRHRLPPPSLLSLGEADRADARLRHSPARPPGRRAGGAAAGRVVDRRHLGLGLLCVGLAALANLLGGAVVTLRRWDDRFLRYAVALGAGFMLAAVILKMLPESQHLTSLAPALVLAGYLLVHLFEHTVARHFHFGEEIHPELLSANAGASALLGLLV